MKRFSTFINELEESKKKLSSGQKALDKDNDGDIDGDDFAMMRKKKNESSEQLDELSPEKLGTYINKASDDASDFQNTSKRKKGIMRATKKLVTKAGGDKDQVTNY